MSVRVLLVVDECVRREVEEVKVGGEVREFFEWRLCGAMSILMAVA